MSILVNYCSLKSNSFKWLFTLFFLLGVSSINSAQVQFSAPSTPIFLSIEGKTADNKESASISITHKNIKQVYFRAWKIDFSKQLYQQKKNKELLPTIKDAKLLLASGGYSYDWSVKLLATASADQINQTLVMTPIKEQGYWVVISSVREDFSHTQNHLDMLHLNITQLAVDIAHFDNQLEVSVRNGITGAIISDASVEVWLHDYDRPPKRVGVSRLSKKGQAILPVHKNNRYFILVKKGNDSTLIQNVFLHKPNVQDSLFKKQNDTLVFVDRDYYQLGEILKWKLISYQKERVGEYTTRENQAIRVQLIHNNKLIKEKQFKTNAMGSIWGHFTIPDNINGKALKLNALLGKDIIAVKEINLINLPTTTANIASNIANKAQLQPIELLVNSDKSFFLVEDKKIPLTASIKHLNMANLSVKGKWRLFDIILPEGAMSDQNSFQLANTYALKQEKESHLNQLLQLFKKGDMLAEGEAVHNKMGKANIQLSQLKEGAYHFEYQLVKHKKVLKQIGYNFLVVAKKRYQLNQESVLLANQKKIVIGDTLMLLLGSNLPDQEMTLSIYNHKKLLKQIELIPGVRLLSLPIDNDYRGGMTLLLQGVRNFKKLEKSIFIEVPWSDKALTIMFNTTRSYLPVGSKEKWLIKIGTKKSDIKLNSISLLVRLKRHDMNHHIDAESVHPLIRTLYPQFKHFTPQLASNYASQLARSIRAIPIKVTYPKRVNESSKVIKNKQWVERKFIGENAKIVLLNMNNKNRLQESIFYPDIPVKKDGSAIFSFIAPKHKGAWDVEVVAISANMKMAIAYYHIETYKPLATHIN